jgi:cell division protein FtsL
VAKSRVAAKRGRLVALLLVGFVLVATGVIWRRSHGFARARVLRDLERRRQALVATKVQLEGAIRDASSRSRLEPIVKERLQMYVPADSQVIYLQRPTRPAEPLPRVPHARPNAPR